MSVYTERVFLGSLVTSTDVYTVPTGKRLIVRDFDARNTHATTSGRAGFADNTGGTTITPVFSPIILAGEHWEWEGRCVFDAGHVVRAVITGASVVYHVQITGYLFDA